MREDAGQTVGLPAMLSVVVGSIIGASIFMLPVSLAPLGWNAALGWMVSGSGALCLAFALASLSRGGRGIQAHIEETFGPIPAFIAAWGFWCGAWTAIPAYAFAASSALSRLRGELTMRFTSLKIVSLQKQFTVSAVLALAAGLTLPSMALADRECSAATIRGVYNFNASGYNIVGGVPQPAAFIFTMDFDGLGNMTTPAVSLSVNGAIFSLPQGNPGNYTVEADCRGTLTFSGGTTYDLQIAPNGNRFNMLQTNPGSVTQGTAHRVSRAAR